MLVFAVKVLCLEYLFLVSVHYPAIVLPILLLFSILPAHGPSKLKREIMMTPVWSELRRIP